LLRSGPEKVFNQEDWCMNGLELLKEDQRKAQGLFEQVKATENERQRNQGDRRACRPRVGPDGASA
jgi:hypothetical protein